MPSRPVGGHGGCSDSDPDPPSPGRSKVLRRSGPHLAQTWHQRRRNFFLTYSWGVKIDFTLCVYAQNAQNFMGNSNMHAN